MRKSFTTPSRIFLCLTLLLISWGALPAQSILSGSSGLRNLVSGATGMEAYPETGMRNDQQITPSSGIMQIHSVGFLSVSQLSTAVEICNNGIDDDGDGWIDGNDPDCSGAIPFLCNGSLYQTYNPGGIWKFVKVETNPVSFTIISDLTNQGLTNTSGINSIGYNTQDNFVYGINPNSPHQIYRLDQAGILYNLGNATGLPGNSYAGCFDLSGNMYITGGHATLYKLNVVTRVATLIGSIANPTADLAFNPVDGQLYAWASSADRLMRINPATAATTYVGPVQSQWNGFGALYFNAQGDIIAYGDNASITSTQQETLVKIDPNTGLVSALGTGSGVNGNDGCSCSANIELTKEVSADTVIPGQVFSYTFTIFNQSGLDVTTSSFHDTLPAGITFASEPYNLTGGVAIGSTSITGSTQCDFPLTTLPDGLSSFVIDVVAQGTCNGDVNFTNQAFIDGLPAFLGGYVASDDPNTTLITDQTYTQLYCTENCTDGIDNDGDGWIDGDDPDCSGAVPHVCDSRLYQTFNPNGDFLFIEVLTNPVAFNTISNLSANGLPSGINSIGYNAVDNFIYGLNPGSPYQFYRIDANGDFNYLGNISGLTSTNQSACFDGSGNMYITGSSNRLYRMAVPGTSAVLVGNLSSGATFGDIAFNPIDNMIYGIERVGTGVLYRVDPNTASATAIGNTGIGAGVGAQYFNAQGELIAYRNNPGALYKVDITNGNASLISTGPNTSLIDGCSCPFGIEFTKTASADTVYPGQTFTYTFTVFNQSFGPYTNVTFSDTLPPGLVWASEPQNPGPGLVIGSSSITGGTIANFSLDAVPVGISSFTIDVSTPSSCTGSFVLSNQAFLLNLPPALGGTIRSDNSNTSAILDPTDVWLQCCPASLGLTASVTDEGCPGAGDGSIDLSVGNGTAPYAYAWSNGSTSQDLSGLAAGTYSVTVTDAFGCSDQATFTVAAGVDNTPPAISCPADATVSCDAPTGPSALGNASATDNCDANPVISFADNNQGGNCPNAYTIQRVWTALDANGNSSSCTQTISVQDQVAPVLAGVPADAAVSCDNIPSAPTVSATDNCDASPTVTFSSAITPGNCAGNYTLTRTWTATDACGNSSSASQTLEVSDQAAPAVSCPANQSQTSDPGQCGANVTYAASASDNCGTVSASYSHNPGSFFPVGTTTVTFTASDDCGNTASCSFDVTITDNEAPSISCPSALNFDCQAEIPAANTSLPSASDNCAVAAVNFLGDTDNGGSGCAGDPLVITRTYEAVDASGNTATCTQTITVESTPIVVSASASPGQYVFPAYGDSSCADLSSNATGGCPPYTIQWSTGATTANISVCPTVSTTYHVTWTDSEGCSGEDSIRICVIDLVCTGGDNNGVNGNGQGGNGQNNSSNAQVHVAMCHIPPGNPNNAMTKCLPVPAVQAHMQQVHGGDHLGACGSLSGRNCGPVGNAKFAGNDEPGGDLESRFEAFPNPFNTSTTIRFTLGSDAFVTLKVYAVNGAEVATLFSGQVSAAQQNSVEFAPAQATEGIYFARLVTSNGVVKTHKLILVK
ncbi:MAG: HYR domain-containing protein [Bacteroidia bacterium]|nr:HYR domain-containing protein [Bacteroidia bacterium]